MMETNNNTAVRLRWCPRWNNYLWWDVIFASVICALGLITNSLGTGDSKTLGFLALAAMAACWPILGRKPVVMGPRRNHTDASQSPAHELPYFWHGGAFVGVMAVAVLVLGYNVPTATFFLVFACPYAWSWPGGRGTLRIATGANMLLCTAAVVGLWGGNGWSAQALLSAGLSGLASFLFSTAMGIWISRIARAAEERGLLRAELQATNLELMEAHRQAGAAAERERFAHEIHDTLTQTLTAVVMLTERARGELDAADAAGTSSTLTTAERTARQALAETRSLIAEGRGVELAGQDFARRIGDVCTRFEEETGIATHPEISGDLTQLRRSDQVVLLRCLQEVLSNVRKHARASTVVVELVQGEGVPGSTYLAITDDGIGFPDSVDAATARGYGLAGIASRLALAIGTMKIITGTEGTRVSITLPGKLPEGGKGVLHE